MTPTITLAQSVILRMRTRLAISLSRHSASRRSISSSLRSMRDSISSSF
jgi:hypothetical protein